MSTNKFNKKKLAIDEVDKTNSWKSLEVCLCLRRQYQQQLQKDYRLLVPSFDAQNPLKLHFMFADLFIIFSISLPIRLCLQKQQRISVDPCLDTNGLESCTNNRIGSVLLFFYFPFKLNSTIYLIKSRQGVLVFMFCAFNGTATKQSLECFHNSRLDSKDVPIINSSLFAALNSIISVCAGTGCAAFQRRLLIEFINDNQSQHRLN